jgi:uncharacterized protein YdhG (YjbR/CyaY superfamily)
MTDNHCKSKEVEVYISTQSREAQKAPNKLLTYIWQAVQNVSELMNYNIPAFALVEGGKRDKQIMIAGYPKHIGFYPHPSEIEAFSEQLSENKIANGSVQFPINKPIPKELVIKMMKYMLSQLVK